LSELPEEPGTIITNSFMMSLWVGVLEDTDSKWLFVSPPPKRWRESDHVVRCLLNWSNGCDPTEAAEGLNARYVLMDTRHQSRARAGRVDGAPDDPGVGSEAAPGMRAVAVYGTFRLWEVLA